MPKAWYEQQLTSWSDLIGQTTMHVAYLLSCHISSHTSLIISIEWWGDRNVSLLRSTQTQKARRCRHLETHHLFFLCFSLMLVRIGVSLRYQDALHLADAPPQGLRRDVLHRSTLRAVHCSLQLQWLFASLNGRDARLNARLVGTSLLHFGQNASPDWREVLSSMNDVNQMVF